MSELIRTTRLGKKILIQKKDQTGMSMTELSEYAFVNMPYIPPKRVKNVKK